jgi:uncharacterized protein YceK
MVPRTLLILVLAAALSACASIATENASTSKDAAATTVEGDKPKMRCYREKNTGYRLGGKRVCEPVS